MSKFQSPIIEASQWNGKDGHLGVKLNDSKDAQICESCGGQYNNCGTFNESDAKNLIVCKGDYIAEGRVRPKLYFESTYQKLRFTNTVDIVPEKVCVENLNELCADWHKAFVSQFGGIPLRVDEELEGGQYFVAVSQELYEQLSHTTPIGVPECPVEA